ncbi:hypothetical protein AB0E88_35500 [Streptomyces sp. NPDC028635]|uniref:hypothetical protein n=1 Tax=Streptomyces sp. NPDC028635 TaxID=3154800 RepID=UPI0033DAECB3
MRHRWAVGAAALALLATSGSPARAAPGSGPVDAVARLHLSVPDGPPPRRIVAELIAETTSGRISHLAAELALPRGVTYDGIMPNSGSDDDVCTPAADGRTVSCVSRTGQSDRVSVVVYLAVDPAVPVDTVLSLTARADIGDAVDTWPRDNTATDETTLRPAADVTLAWRKPSGPAVPDRGVETPLVVTNHGPANTTQLELTLSVMGDYWPSGYEDVEQCWTDPGVLMCLLSGLAPGESISLPLSWRFPRKATGTTYEAPASIRSVPADPKPANNADTLRLTIAEPPPPAHRPALAVTAAAGAAVVAVGGAVLLLRRRARRSA